MQNQKTTMDQQEELPMEIEGVLPLHDRMYTREDIEEACASFDHPQMDDAQTKCVCGKVKFAQ